MLSRIWIKCLYPCEAFGFVKIIYAWIFPWDGCCIKLFCRYKNELQKEDKDDLRILLKKQKHKLVRLSFLMPIIVSLLFVGSSDLHKYLFQQNMISMHSLLTCRLLLKLLGSLIVAAIVVKRKEISCQFISFALWKASHFQSIFTLRYLWTFISFSLVFVSIWVLVLLLSSFLIPFVCLLQ